jgi:hypothetical protein
MEMFAPGKVMRLSDVPVGGVIGAFDRGQYVRFLRTASETQTHVTIVSLGPFCDEDYPHTQGPTSYFWEADDEFVFEEKTAIAPKLDTATDPAAERITLGAIVLSKSGQICLLSRTPNTGRALIDLSSGELIKNDRATVFYKHYVLVAPDEVGERKIVFDSSTLSKKVVLASV